ncbi:MAG: tRNA (adenosine(37)-N6)-threonylcarbamoyltransferase complex transferase subunit TsaD [Rhodospirillales bacterium]|nr:tRNA (adenosine(37)-N6)-threonylcarbamoyltransferase complex transferase subunit TsaD [Rhodospirillales bacterium]MCB9964633.1 tRNA (adenosine(37)-N6)-threonylcarbamoyltransferase complex transferase subunit TsaD [Rhodospirillales bacterium]MCB9979923.1 tRNA (adenosine(37)-N6)-threonylcarbamoyltransferase complex transferase subunit TsaD [Rhodospirillales bacterium]
MSRTTIVLGIESSCDETAVGIVTHHGDILANRLLTQVDEHKLYGGVVPEIAARAHLDHLDKLIDGAMQDAGIQFSDLSAVAATCGPGLIGGVMVGMMSGKAIAAARNIPFIGINHLEAHALTPRLTDRIEFPFLLLLISGMNTQLLAVEGVGAYRCLGKTIDDAIGECFDKSGRIMNLGYPAGPFIQKYALACPDLAAARTRYPLPHPLKGKKTLDFSFSGLKTAVRNHVTDGMSETDKQDLCASLQQTMVEILEERCTQAMMLFRSIYSIPSGTSPAFVISGGVAANKPIRDALETLTTSHGFGFFAPPVHLCGDNGVMIAWAGIEHLRLNRQDGLDMPARPRWPLEDLGREG